MNINRESSRRRRTGRAGEDDDDDEDWEEEEFEMEELEGRSPKASWKSYLRPIWSSKRSSSSSRSGGSGAGAGAGRGGDGGNRSSNNGLFIEPNCRWYVLWTHFILLWAVYSSFFTPLEFAFFRGLPENLFLLDIAGQFAFLVDIIVRFFVVYRDHHSYTLVYNHNLIAIRYLRSRFIVDLLGCFPWDYIYKVSGRKEPVRYLLWIRLSRALRVTEFFEKMEKDIRVNYLFTRIIKLFVVELYCTHTAACIFYYLATTLPPSREGYTWIGSLKMGDYSYMHFREIDLWTRYITSLYFAIVTMATVGYGEIHAVNPREMIFVMIYVSFDMILGAYLVGNMTALIVKGSKTEKFRDRMADLIKYMNRNKLGKDIRKEIKRRVQLQYESGHNEAAALQDVPIATRAKIAQTIYEPYIRKVPLFSGCSDEFLKQTAINVHEEFFLPGELVIEHGDIVDQLYFVCYGKLDEVQRHGDYGTDESLLSLGMYSSVGEVFVLCDMPVPYTLRANQLCRLLQINKQAFLDILDKCFLDGRIIINNLLEGKESSIRAKILESKAALYVAKHESEFAMRLNCAAQYGDLHRLKCFVEAGADLNLTDYSGRSALHVAAAKGYDDVVQFLIEKGASVNVKDIFGNTPLLEALRNGYDAVTSLLTNAGASLLLDNAGNCLCEAVASKELEFLRRLLENGVNSNSRNYDLRTPLHIASSEGLYPASVILLKAGASVLSVDRWGKTPLDEARVGGNRKLINLLEEAKRTECSELSSSFTENQGLKQKMKCTVFPQNPWHHIAERRTGVVLWIPESIEELIETAKEKLQFSSHSTILLTEDGGRILDINMICDDQKLFLVNETPYLGISEFE